MFEMRPKTTPTRLTQLRRKSTGMGLISAIALITLAAVLSIAIMRSVRTGSDSSVQSIVSFRAFLAAESGAQLGANRLFAPVGSGSCIDRSFALADLGLPSCNADVACRTEAVAGETLFTLQSTATCSPEGFTATHSVVVRLTE